jgi:glutathione synthase/RimK-type ligase-like ATP-grasp enzyme
VQPIAIFHEHPDWFRPLFAELDRRSVPYVRLDAASHSYDPAERTAPYAVVFNRASPSAYLRGHRQSTFYTLQWLRHLERLGVPVVNGASAYEMDISKALQADVFERLSLPYPTTRIANSMEAIVDAGRGLRYPVLVKANVGGSGAGIERYDDPTQLEVAARAGTIDCGVDGVALVQEMAPLRAGHITRVEVLGGKFLYAINVFPAPDSLFNLCPADVCQTTDGRALSRSACALDAPKTGLRVEGTEPDPSIVAEVERIARAVRLDVGGIEFLIDDRDGRRYYYDVNALSNFVADARRVVGFDPHERLVDYLLDRAARVERTSGLAAARSGSPRPVSPAADDGVAVGAGRDIRDPA